MEDEVVDDDIQSEERGCRGKRKRRGSEGVGRGWYHCGISAV